jgi:5'-nucleotidase (lipoprotein e(P4) family)
MFAIFSLLLASPVLAFETSDSDHLELKWVRDSIEFSMLTQQIFANGVEKVLKNAEGKKKWAVVLDIDETVLDNSTYWLELSAYNRRFDWHGWNAWCERRVAEPIGGAKALVDAIRRAKGRIAYISNRHEATLESTIDNLKEHGFYDKRDLVCLKTDDKEYNKRVRRTEARSGEGNCSWSGVEVEFVGYFGDTIHDFPEDDEEGAREGQFGSRYFMLPNPMYGGWEHDVTK